MKVFSIICESFNRHDLFPEDFKAPWNEWDYQEHFRMAPARCSVSAFYCLQTGENTLPKLGRRKLFLPTKSDYLGDRVKQRVISSAWPTYCNARRFDRRANMRHDRAGEKGRVTLQRFLREEFYQSNIDHLIFWGRIGHIGVRAKPENRGTPKVLRETWRWHMEWCQEWIMPLIDFSQTLVLAHPDHGSLRRGLTESQSMHDGFLFSSQPLDPVTGWKDLQSVIVDWSRRS